MPERNFHLKLKVLQKYKKELCEKVKFSDVSHTLLSLECLSKEDCFEICILPSSQQMSRCYDKLLQGFVIESSENSEKQSQHDIWTILLRALTADHPGITCKLDSELQKLSKKEKPKRLTKDDIGVPMNFKHLQHIGQSPFRRFLSLRSTNSAHTVNEDDPDVKSFFEHAGVTEKHLRQPRARKFIFDFIEKSGGIEAIRKEVRLSSSTSSNISPISPIPQIQASGSTSSSLPLSPASVISSSADVESSSPLSSPFSP